MGLKTIPIKDMKLLRLKLIEILIQIHEFHSVILILIQVPHLI